VELARDLGSADLWAASLERSLARRGRPRRASLALGRLTAERDLGDEATVNESVVYWRTRRAASAGSAFSGPAVGGASVFALLAATTLPSLTGGAGGATDTKGAEHRANPGTGGHAAPPAHTIIHHVTRPQAVFTTVADHTPAPTTTAATAPVSTAAPDVTEPAVRPVVYGKISYGDIRDAQRMLGVTIDGALGPKTGAAIRAFQAAHGLAVDGDIGRLTWDALAASEHAQMHAATLAAEHTSVPATTPTVHEASVMQQGIANSDTSAVMALQQALGIPADGTFGAATTAAVAAFQTAHGLTADGVAGPSTRTALGLGDGPTLQQATADGGTSSPGTDAPATVTTDPTATTAPDATTAPATDPTAATTTDTSTTGAATSTTVSAPATSTTTTPASVTAVLDAMTYAADQIATLPYIWGGGHGSWISPGYDCSGSVSYVLHAGGLLSVPEDSTGLESYGAPGPGQYITIYANAGHAWMTIDGRRFDTVALSETGSRWADGGGEFAGYIVRHPVGF